MGQSGGGGWSVRGKIVDESFQSDSGSHSDGVEQTNGGFIRKPRDKLLLQSKVKVQGEGRGLGVCGNKAVAVC